MMLKDPRRRLFSGAAAWVAVAAAAAGAETGASDAAAPDEPSITAADRAHWAFQPPVRPDQPDVEHAVDPIDAFVLARLEDGGLTFAPEADRAVLLRRVTLGLTGLPPTPDEVAAFLADDGAGAYERVVDRLLASPRFGEAQARWWLEVARFAESDGFEHDKVRDDAWRYRDWVISALNADLPYDEFVRLQIAGDELAPGDESAAAATGFLVCGPDMPDINLADERRHNVLNDITSTVGAAFLGLTLRCASCHDHKSDPVSQADFYRLRAFFENLEVPPKDKQLPHRFVPEKNEPRASFVRVRGEFSREGAPAPARFPRVLNPDGGEPAPEPRENSPGLRAELAAWLTDPNHPLTARVAVNRLWLQHFGVPLSGTPNDFGKLGARPTHPELLDWLAIEFVRRGWSMKAIHRLIVTSRAYRQASFPADTDPAAQRHFAAGRAADPENALLWRMNRQRLSGETLRDVILAAAGTLNLKEGGPGVRPPLPKEVTVTLLKDQWPVTEDESEHTRRSIYLFARRNLKFPMFDVFDRPDAAESCGRRHVSTTAPQALVLLNGAFAAEAARGIAARVRDRVAGENPSPETLAAEACLLILGRPPDPETAHLAAALIQDASLEDCCLGLINLNAFVFLE